MNKAKQLSGKMNDFKRYGYTLLALTAFLYLGVVMPVAGKTLMKTYILMGSSAALIILSVLCFRYSNKCQKQLLECEDGEEYMQ